ncbi:MAG: hypothetical protein HWE30_13400 [Methylocystaceae bacterium]|nr:hypothetical protein [Methylocystaceae bacterium]
MAIRDKKIGPVALAWSKTIGKKVVLSVMLGCFLLCLASVIYFENQNETLRNDSLTQFARSLAATTLSSGGEADDILLKVNDLLTLDAVLGLRLHKDGDTPLSVGDTKSGFPPLKFEGSHYQEWSVDKTQLDIAFQLDKSLPFDQIVMRLDTNKLSPTSVYPMMLKVFATIFISLLTGLICLWTMGRGVWRPLEKLNDYFKDHNAKYATTALPQDLFKKYPDYKLLGEQIETLRTEILKAKEKAEFQARFLQETPYPLIRCSVNRKVMYANGPARSLSPLFGDDTREFVSPAVSELIRKSFQDAKQIYGDVRCGDKIITFRAIPILETGYVNLYGEVSRGLDEEI